MDPFLRYNAMCVVVTILGGILGAATENKRIVPYFGYAMMIETTLFMLRVIYLIP